MPYLDKQWLERVAQELEKLEPTSEVDALKSELDDLMKHHGIIKSLVFTKNLCLQIEALFGDEKLSSLLENCSCYYPMDKIKKFKKCYDETGDILAVNAIIQDEFETELLETQGFSKHQLEFIKVNEWGPAGHLKNEKLYITKIPDQYIEYFETTDSLLKNSYYCHCKRIKDGLKFGFDLPKGYCHCGVGYVKHLWSEILGTPVEVNQEKSILNGDSVCQFVVKLPVK